MAHKKSGGSTSLGRDSQAKRLGIKKFAGQAVLPGMILVKQRGTLIRPSHHVKRGKDDTLYAQTAGLVRFFTKKIKRFNGQLKPAKFIEIVKK